MLIELIFNFKGKKFSAVLDSDYDLVSFAVEDPNDRIEVAEHIAFLLETSKKIEKPQDCN